MALGMVLFSCSTPGDNNADDQGQDIVTIDNHFNKLFMGECWGFTGGDGTYSVLLPDRRIVWIFGDTFIDGVNPDNSRKKTGSKVCKEQHCSTGWRLAANTISKY